MKTPIGMAFAASLILASPCLALSPLVESFDGATLTSGRWSFFTSPNALLQHSQDRLNFKVLADTSDEDYCYAELVNNQPGYNENWQLTLEVKNSAGKGDDAGVGFWIYNADNFGDVVFFEFFGNKRNARRVSVSASFVLGGKYLDRELNYRSRILTSGKLKVVYSGISKRFTFHFKNSDEGSDWANLGSFSVNGVGGDARANWNMNPGSGRFGIRLQAYAEETLIGKRVIFMDNFELKGVR